MKLYLLRHGRTRWNEEGKLQGRTDVPLNEEGRAGALRAREELRNVPFSAVFSSPLSRARETAEIIAAGKAAVTTDARLLELRFGAAEGMDIFSLPPEERPTYLLFSDPARYVPPAGGERWDELLTRCGAFLHDVILPGEGRWEHVLIVAHGGAVRGLFGSMFGPRAGEIYGRRVQKNCAVNIVDCTGGTFSPVQIAREYCEGV